jgi:hypothetical protein
VQRTAIGTHVHAEKLRCAFLHGPESQNYSAIKLGSMAKKNNSQRELEHPTVLCYVANMCGILAAFGLRNVSREEARRLALKHSRLLRHRGPDANLIYQTSDGHSFMAHERLNIVDATDRGRYACVPTISARPGGCMRIL